MRYDLVIRNLDRDVMKDFREWCMDHGIPIAGRNSLFGPTICEIIHQHITPDKDDAKTRIAKFKEALDRYTIRRRTYWLSPKDMIFIVQDKLKVGSPNLIKHYAALVGYEYDRRRKMYKVPNRATPASQAHLDDKERIDPEAEKILEATMKHAEKVLGNKVKPPLNDGGIKPEKKKASERAGAGSGPNFEKSANPNHGHMPDCPVCGFPVHTKQPRVIENKETYHEECYTSDKSPRCPVCKYSVHTRQSSVERRGKTYHEDCYNELENKAPSALPPKQ